MRLIALCFLLFSSTVMAGPQWPDIEMGKTYKLNQDFVFPNGFTIPAGEEIESHGLIGLGIGLVLFEAHVTNCTYPELELEVELFYVPTEIGLTVQPGCELWFYVENKDIYTEAPLE